MTRLKLLTLFLILSGLGALYAQDAASLRLDYPMPGVNASGGPHAAYGNDYTLLFTNPAGFRYIEDGLQVAEATLHLAGPIFDITSTILQGMSGSDIAALLLSSDLVVGLYAALDFAGPISFTLASNGFAVGVFNWFSTSFENTGALNIKATVQDTLLVGAGYSFRLPLPEESKQRLDVGIFGKIFFRGEVISEKDLLGISDLFSDPASLVFGEPFYFTIGLGVDVGIMYNINDIFAIGIVGKDVFTAYFQNEFPDITKFLGNSSTGFSYALVPVNLSVGIMFSVPLSRARVLTALRFFLDYRDILDFLYPELDHKHWFLHLAFGAEMGLMEILTIKLGLNEGYLCGGLGLDLSFAKIHIAMYGTEKSTEPGMRPVYNLTLGMDFSY